MARQARVNGVDCSTPSSAITVRALGAHTLGDDPTGIAVAPRPARDVHGLRLREQRGAWASAPARSTAVVMSVDRLERLGGIVEPLVRDARADQHRSTGIEATPYFRWKFGRALLGEGLGALLGVRRRHHRHADGLLEGERLLLAHVLGLAQRLEDRLDRERAVAGHGRRDLARLVERGAVGHDVARSGRAPSPRPR